MSMESLVIDTSCLPACLFAFTYLFVAAACLIVIENQIMAMSVNMVRRSIRVDERELIVIRVPMLNAIENHDSIIHITTAAQAHSL